MSRQRMWSTMLFVAVALLSTTARAQQKNDPRSDEDRLRINTSGYVQFDTRNFPAWNAFAGTGRLNRQESEIRRLRGGLEVAWKNLTFELGVDPLDDDGTLIQDAFVAVRVRDGFRLRGGQFKLPGSREYDRSARRADFMERSVLASELAPGRDIGVMLDADRGALRYELGVFTGDGNGRQERAGATAAARILWEPVPGLDLSTYTTIGSTDAVDHEAANGLNGRSASGYRFFDRVYVHGRRVRTGGDVEFTRGRLQLSAAGLRVSDERRGQGVDHDDLPSLIGEGWTLAGSWRFGARHDGTHETKAGRRQRWPWQLALRFEHAAFDDDGPSTGRSSVRPRASEVRERGLDALTLALSYELGPWARVIADAGLERYIDPRTAPTPGDRGDYFITGLRVQLGF